MQARTWKILMTATPVIETMGGVFPELRAREKEIRSVLSGEEASFSKTLERGLAMFEKLAAGSGQGIKGEDAFTLYDTYGFPLDLTQLLAHIVTGKHQQHRQIGRAHV